MSPSLTLILVFLGPPLTYLAVLHLRARSGTPERITVAQIRARIAAESTSHSWLPQDRHWPQTDPDAPEHHRGLHAR
ncbi:hypothetical protein FPZ12_011095 [Amycolatopsis acidicola]|uniref:Uncharacterized protein n=1 Tax=Amycolatopsis acidicola TaxID=2596893 RepID=A0A5N0V9B5_9PSEU|nr:hypothetical protein [Amycolatopsis acidicola]KAA9162595.1 hypothetical protein FPZ12_011095 [Amycolatopsis acidicola]